jgi:Fe/S biogenesis protein NfuA
MLNFTDAARRTVQGFMSAGHMDRPGLRIELKDSSPLAPEYELALVEDGDQEATDLRFDADGFTVYVDAGSAPRLQGATIDFIDRDGQNGFDIRNPNIKPIGLEPPSGDLADRVRQVIQNRINPGVASHGGQISLVDVRDNVVYLQMSGGCQGCGMAQVTLRQGVEKMIREAVPEVVAVQDVTNHQLGQNPYYQPTG